MKRAGLLFLLLLLLGPLAPGAAAQERPLEEFVQQVGRLWSAGDVGAIIAAMPARGTILLDTGGGLEQVNARNARAALRALFGDRETLGVRPVRITLAGGAPPRGFGELTWSFRARSAPATQTRTVYVGAAWEDGGWSLTELRVMP